MFRESYKSAMNEIETNKELLNSLLGKADKVSIPQKEKFTVLKKVRAYTMSTLATAAAVVLVAVSVKTFKNPANEKAQENIVPKLQVASEETLDIKSEEIAAFDETKMAKNVPAGIVRELTKDEYYNHIGINIEKLKIPADLKNQSDNKISILESESGEIVTDYHTFSFTGKDERYVSVSTATIKEADTEWIKTVSDKNYIAVYSIRNGVKINVECYMLSAEEQKTLLDSFNN